MVEQRTSPNQIENKQKSPHIPGVPEKHQDPFWTHLLSAKEQEKLLT